jgi:hypothetical protein
MPKTKISHFTLRDSEKVRLQDRVTLESTFRVLCTTEMGGNTHEGIDDEV